MIIMKKRIVCATAALLISLSSSVLPVYANRAEPEAWQLSYFELLKEYSTPERIDIPPYAFVDFNQDGVLELIIRPGSHGFDVELIMEIYTFADGELRQFSGLSYDDTLPDGYRNRRTGEMKCVHNAETSAGRSFREEMIFDFDTYQIAFAEIPISYHSITQGYSTTAKAERTFEQRPSQAQHENALKEWEEAYALVIPFDAYYDYLNCPSSMYQDYRNYDEVQEKMLEVISKAPTLDNTRADRSPILRGAAVIGGIAVLAAAITVPVSLAKKAKKRRA